MPRRNSTVKIVDGKVVFSEEVLSYFEDLRTEENSAWIDGYFDVFLWKIFNNQDLKSAFQRMCGQRKYIDNLTEKELKEIATLKENCAKKNIGRKQT